jgi:hypothetical protein
MAPGLALAHPLVVLTLPLWLLLVATVPRDRRTLGVLAVAVAAVALTASPRIHYHQDRAYAEILEATGVASVDVVYGDGWASLLAWPMLLSGGHPDSIHVAQAVLTILAVPHLVGGLRPVLGETAALGAGVLLAVAPLPLALATTETRYVTIAALQAAAVHGLHRRDGVGDLLVGLAGGLISHLRPFELAVSAVLLVLTIRQRRGLASALLVALVGLRVAQLVGSPPSPGGAFGAGWSVLIGAQWLGREALVVAFDPTTTSPLVVGLAALGAVVGLRRAPVPTLALLAAFVLASGVYTVQSFPIDRLRMQLPAQTWLAALGGLGLSGLPRIAAAAAVLAVGLWSSTLRNPVPVQPWQVEYATLRAALRAVPPGSVVAYDGRLDRGWMRAWAEGFAPVRLVPLAEAPPGAWRWVGLSDHVAGPFVWPPGEVVVEARTVTDITGLWGNPDAPPREVVIGLVRPP